MQVSVGEAGGRRGLRVFWGSLIAGSAGALLMIAWSSEPCTCSDS